MPHNHRRYINVHLWLCGICVERIIDSLVVLPWFLPGQGLSVLRCGDYAHMSVGISEHEAGGFGEHHGFGVAHTLLVKTDTFRREGHMRVFGDVLWIDDHAVVLHAAEIKHLAAGHIERAEL